MLAVVVLSNISDLGSQYSNCGFLSFNHGPIPAQSALSLE